MAGNITRQNNLPVGGAAPTVIAVDSVLADAAEIDISWAAGGGFILPTGETMVTLTFYVAEKKGGTYKQLYDKTNAAISRTVAASRAYPLPDEIYGFPWLKIVGNADGTLYICLKG